MSLQNLDDLDVLLAELQTTIQKNGANVSENYAMHVTSHSYQYQHGDLDNEQPVYANQQVEDISNLYQTVNKKKPKTSSSQKIEDLDSLLQDLSVAKFSAAPAIEENHGRLLSSEYPTAADKRNDWNDGLASEETVPSASSATQELDVLMASLSTFKGGAPGSSEPIAVNPAPAATVATSSDATYAKPNKVQRAGTKDQLDSMLGNLQADMNKQGISATQKGCCSACDKPIVGKVITALGRTWHPEHFVCGHCHQELGTKSFFERDGQPYCEGDYHNLFSPRCAYCNGPILDKCVTALEQTWHPEHFFCTQCGCQFGEDGFHERDGKPYCKKDYVAMFAMKCKGCSMAITEGYISALNGQWHSQCFVCRDCNIPFQGGSFFVHEGMPYCETHYHAKRGSLCAGCHKPIAGRCITAMFRKYHPEHFVCSYCLQQLKKGTFKEQGDKPYCHPCFDKLFG